MAGSIKGITVEIGGNTMGLQKALSDVNTQSRNLASEMREVDRALKFDPTNTELLVQKQEILSKQIENTSEKLQSLKNVQGQVNDQFANGQIGEEQYRAFQREVINTESYLKSLEQQQNELDSTDKETTETIEKNTAALKKNGETADSAGDNFSNLKSVVSTVGKVLVTGQY